MYSYDHILRVRYGETDKMGVVYYGNYSLYYESGRTEAMRHLGVSYAALEKDGILLPVTSYHCDYKRSAEYDDELIVRSSIKVMPTARIRFDYELLKGDNLLSTAYTEHAFVDRETWKPKRAPEQLIESLKVYLG